MIALAFALGCTPTDVRPDVLLVTLDTTRADALGPWRIGGDSTTPVLDHLAAEGVVVEETVAVAPLTLPAHASILTGLYPDRHGVVDNNGFVLDERFSTLAERLQAAGWQTGGFVAAAVLDRRLGIAQGFDTFEDGFDSTSMRAARMAVPSWPAPVVRQRAQVWLEGVRAVEPLLLWVHFYDAHLPHEPPAEWLAAAGGDPYAAEIAHADHQIGVLLDQIAALERDRPLVVAVVGDHGEGRGDHGEQTHGWFLYRSTMAVPMLFWGAGVPKGQRIPRPASNADITPTVAHLAGLPPAPGLDGVDVLGEGVRSGEVLAFSAAPRLQFGYADLTALVTPRWKYVRAPRPELYEWEADPTESSDRADPEVRAQLSSRLDAALARPGAESSPEVDLSTALATLGYVAPLAFVPVDVASSDLPDPKDDPGLFAEFSALVDRARSRPPGQGAEILEGWLATHPNVGAVRLLLVRAHSLAGNVEGARSALAPLLAERPDDPALRLHAVSLDLLAGTDPAGAVRELAALVALHPDQVQGWVSLATARRGGGDCAGAVREVDRGLALHPEASALLLVRGACALDGGDLEGALSDLDRGWARDRENPDLAFLRGASLLRLGRWSEARAAFHAQLALVPDAPDARAGIALADLGRGDAEAAWSILAEVAPLLAGDADVQLGRLVAGLAVGRPRPELERALAALEAAAPGHPELEGLRAAVTAR